FRRKFDLCISVNDDFRARLGREFIPVDDALCAKVFRIARRVCDVVAVRQKNVTDSAGGLELSRQMAHKFWRIDEPVAGRVPHEVTVPAERFFGIESAVRNLIFDWYGKIVDDFRTLVLSGSADRACRAREQRPERAAAFLRRGGLTRTV